MSCLRGPVILLAGGKVNSARLRRPGRDFAFPDTNVVMALLAMLSALRLVAGSKHAPRAFASAYWQAGASSDRGIHKTNQNLRKVN